MTDVRMPHERDIERRAPNGASRTAIRDRLARWVPETQPDTQVVGMYLKPQHALQIRADGGPFSSDGAFICGRAFTDGDVFVASRRVSSLLRVTCLRCIAVMAVEKRED